MKKVLSLILSLVMLLNITVAVDLSAYADTEYSSNGYRYTIQENGTITITDYYGTGGKVTIPSTIDGRTVSTIGYGAFYGNRNIVSITVPSSVTYIDELGLYLFNCKEYYILNPYCAFGDDAFGLFYDEGIPIILYADEESTTHQYINSFDDYDYIKFVAYDTHNHTSNTVTKATTSKDGKIITKCTYCGKTVKTTIIKKISSVTLSKTSYTYDGKEKKPGVIVKNSNGKAIASGNYTVAYPKGRKNVGSYTVTITFKGNYRGTVKRTFKINKKTLKKSNLKLKNIVYTGKTTYPKVTYSGKTLKKGTDYTISKISKNKKIGTASVTLKMKGNYSGTIKTTYKIVPGKVKGISLKSRDTSSITVKWKKVKGVDGYKVYRYNYNKGKYVLYKTTKSASMKINRVDKNTSYVDIYIKAYKKSGKKTYTGEASNYYYNCVKPGKIKYSVTCSNIGKIRLNYSGVKNYKYVQIQLCINKTFNDNKYDVKNFYTSIAPSSKYVEIYNLKSNKTYYVRSREYNYSSSNNAIYGKWGDVKKIYVQ